MKHKNIFIILISILLLIVIPLFIYHGRIEITFNDQEELYWTIDKPYKDPGLTIKKNGHKLNKDKYNLIINSNINESRFGDYYVTYQIDYLWNKYTKKRIVHVVDNLKPEITINVKEIEKDYCTKKLLTKYEYKSIDNYDGDITNNVEIIEKEDKLLFISIDKNNNKSEVSIPIIIKKNDPIFELNGNSTIYLSLNEKYYEPGIIYQDECGNSINEKINIDGNVDPSHPGTYTITYNVDNKSLSRKVIVENYSSNKTIYLTFDDGPGMYTERVLSILNKYNVKATFFVTHQFDNYISLIKNEYEAGHAIGIHSYTHNWNIYTSVDTYLDDFDKMNNDINNYTGSTTSIFRFPGGSSNTISRNYSQGIMQSLASKMTEKGYAYFDWDVDSGDAAGSSREAIYRNVINGAKRCNQCVILMHDIKSNTVNELDDILKTLTAQGYQFSTLNTSSPTAHQRIAN